ncbi:DUF748 domain-containing protein [Casimicrobium huifangae]|uniref:DUF748 domain-containing protein n=1 Tax=Casimicrobium huifangae TaxID=2591109 RepID=UPI0012EC1ECF|nr:DUF748 domain-containing protein [Casimicrobium huifangae]
MALAVSSSSTASASAPPPLQPRRNWHRLRLIALIALAVVGLLLGQLAVTVPHLLQSVAPAWIKDKTGRVLHVGQASFNPFTLHLAVSEVSLKDGGATLASLHELELRGAWSSLFNVAWTVDKLSLTKPEINARIGKDGSIDWQRFVDAFPKSDGPPSSTVPRVLLRNVTVDQGSVRLIDEREAAGRDRLTLTPLSFSIEKLSTLPRDRGDYSLEATLNDQTRVHWQGRVGLNPIESSGELTVSNLPLARAAAMAGAKLPVTLDGVATLRANYSAAFGTDFAAAGIGGGVLEVSGLRASQGEDVAEMKTLRITPLSASWAKTRIDGREQQLVAVLPLQVSAGGLQTTVGGRKEPLLAIGQIATTAPVNVDLAARRIDIPQLRIDELRAALERRRDGTLALPFSAAGTTNAAGTATVASTANAAGVAAITPPTLSVPSALAPASPAAPPWRITLGELVTDAARIGLLDESFAVPQRAALTLNATLGATAELSTPVALRLSGKRLTLNDLTLRDSKADSAVPPWLGVKEIRAAAFDTALTGPKIELPRIEIIAPLLALARDGSGVDVARRFAPATPEAGVAATTAPPTAPAPTAALSTAISIAGVALSGGRVTVTDSALAKPVSHMLDGIAVNTDRIELNGAAGSKPLTATARATLQSGGTLQAKARYDLRQQQGEVDLGIERAALAAFSPYLSNSTRLSLDTGEASLGGKLALNSAATASKTGESLRFAGKASIRELKLTDQSTQQMFAQWAELSSQDLKLTTGAGGTRVELADLLLDQPRGDIVIGEDGSLNLTQIGKVGAPATPATTALSSAPAAVAGPAAPATTASSAPGDAAPTKVKIDRVQVTGGDVHFADLSLRPQFGTRVSDLSGLIVGISSEASSRAEVSLEGKVDEFGLARLSGTVAPASAAQYTDLKASFRNLEMRNLTPYSGKFAGRKIESGKLSLELEYKVLERKLKGENQIVIDNLKLGERVESKDATSLPLDLAIALLSDSKGVIDLGLPVQGSLDDPQFSMGGLVWKAITNLLTKIVTAPFRALGALLGGSGEEFEAVLFEPGEARLLPPEREKLAKLATALEKRPQLKLAIEGRFDRERDREALADNILKLEVSKRAGMKPPGANEPLVISFTDSKVQAALDELAASAGDDAAKLRAQYLPPAGNALTGLLQGARERLTEKGRSEAADARGKYYPELFRLLRGKQQVPDIAYATLAGFRAEAIRNTLTAVNKFDAARVSVAAPQPAKTSQPDRVATTLALSVK